MSNSGGKLEIVPGRVVKPKKGIIDTYSGLYRVVLVTDKGIKVRNEHGTIPKRLFYDDELIIVK